ncbi:MAG: restriction endonuclease subunit S [Melioribacteraceae bacterium]|nr:restriction endonuclease subunit S [Melioribacteraceae bacterium]MCF8355041.1 restriction endonuclease subunit S [Melioribacteraceae bacterium]MCF8392720.1 restriction endonuclease subunit S [Melioribacteraceae bacterium]MCF8417742.1 restriction endonuclease subunit S [Melioribacteraceae bacterium]
MKLQLKDIVEINTGLYQKPKPGGNVVYFQIRNLTENGQIDPTEEFSYLNSEDISDKYFLRKNDIMFAAKGFTNIAVVYKNEIKPAVASSVFFVLRLNERFINQILHEFIVWFLNNKLIQIRLQAKAKGTSVKSISKKDLGDIEIPVPDIKTQKRILEMNELWLKEKDLTAKLIEEKDKFYNGLLNNIANKNA